MFERGIGLPITRFVLDIHGQHWDFSENLSNCILV